LIDSIPLAAIPLALVFVRSWTRQATEVTAQLGNELDSTQQPNDQRPRMEAAQRADHCSSLDQYLIDSIPNTHSVAFFLLFSFLSFSFGLEVDLIRLGCGSEEDEGSGEMTKRRRSSHASHTSRNTITNSCDRSQGID